MLKLRIEGEEPEVKQFAEAISKCVDVLAQSAPYANRGVSKYVRVYMDIKPKKGITVENGCIIEASETALYEYYKSRYWHSVLSFTEFKKVCENLGAVIHS